MNETEYFVIQKTFGDPAGDVLNFTVEKRYKTCIIKIGMDVHIDRSDFIRLLFDGRFVRSYCRKAHLKIAVVVVVVGFCCSCFAALFFSVFICCRRTQFQYYIYKVLSFSNQTIWWETARNSCSSDFFLFHPASICDLPRRNTTSLKRRNFNFYFKRSSAYFSRN